MRGTERGRPDVSPTYDDPVVAATSEVVGGPVGAHAGRHRWWTPVRVLLALTAVTFVVGMVQSVPCAEDRWRTEELRYTHMCYSDLPYLYTGRGFVELSWPYADDTGTRARFETMEYPVGISYWAWGTAWVTHLLSGSPDISERQSRPLGEVAGRADVVEESVRYVAVNAVGFAALAFLATWFLAGVNRGRAWDAAGFAVAPALALTGLVNWDLVAVAAVAGALWAWARDRPAWAGVLIGVGAATKLYPVLLLGGILVICLRRRRWLDLLTASLWTVAAWAVVNVPAYLTGPESWRHFWTFNSDRGPDLGSAWLLLAQSGLWQPDLDTVNLVSLVFLVVWCAAVLAVGMLAPSTPRLAQLGFLVVAGFLLVNKVYSPQYVLWLLPLAALARPRWRDLLIWQAGEVVYFGAVWFYLGEWLQPSAGTHSGWYWAAIVLRILAELWLVAVVTRDVLRPRHDPAADERDAGPAWVPALR